MVNSEYTPGGFSHAVHDSVEVVLSLRSKIQGPHLHGVPEQPPRSLQATELRVDGWCRKTMDQFSILPGFESRGLISGGITREGVHTGPISQSLPTRVHSPSSMYMIFETVCQFILP